MVEKGAGYNPEHIARKGALLNVEEHLGATGGELTTMKRFWQLFPDRMVQMDCPVTSRLFLMDWKQYE